MFALIIAGLLLIPAAVLFFIPIRSGFNIVEGEPDKYGYAKKCRQDTYLPKVWGIVPLLIAIVVLVIASTTMIPAKTVGVVTTFGKPSADTLSPGLHFKAPWQDVTEIDATIQTDEYHGDSSIMVRLNDGNTANVSAAIRWSVSEENANQVYADFRSDNPTENLRDAVVSTQLKAAMNSVFSTFDPLSLAGGEGQEAPDYNALANEVEKVMLTKTNDLVKIESVTISLLSLDAKSQSKIDNYIGEVAKTRVAEQAQRTATAQAKANDILSDSIDNDPNVLVSRCLDLLAEGEFDAPAGFTCWPGDNGSVVIPGTK